MVTFASALPAGSTLRVGDQRRRVRELMRAAGVPPWSRDSLPLLVDAHGLAAVPGIARRDPAESGTPGSRPVHCTWETAAADEAR